METATEPVDAAVVAVNTNAELSADSNNDMDNEDEEENIPPLIRLPEEEDEFDDPTESNEHVAVGNKGNTTSSDDDFLAQPIPRKRPSRPMGPDDDNSSSGSSALSDNSSEVEDDEAQGPAERECIFSMNDFDGYSRRFRQHPDEPDRILYSTPDN